MDKREKAFLLFKAGTKHNDIADILSVSTNTIGKWSSQGEWAKKILSQKTDEQTRTDITMKILMYQLRCIENMVDQNIEDKINKPLDGKYADGILKLYNTIKTEAASYEITIKVINKFMDYVAAMDLDTAKKLIDISKTFLADEKSNV